MKTKFTREKLEKRFGKYEDCLFPEDVSKMLRLGLNTVYRMLHNKILPSYMIANRYHIAKEDIIDYILESGYTESLSAAELQNQILDHCEKEDRTATEIAQYLGLSTQYCRTLLIKPLCQQRLLKCSVSSGNDRRKGVVLYKTSNKRAASRDLKSIPE